MPASLPVSYSRSRVLNATGCATADIGRGSQQPRKQSAYFNPRRRKLTLRIRHYRITRRRVRGGYQQIAVPLHRLLIITSLMRIYGGRCGFAAYFAALRRQPHCFAALDAEILSTFLPRALRCRGIRFTPLRRAASASYLRL